MLKIIINTLYSVRGVCLKAVEVRNTNSFLNLARANELWSMGNCLPSMLIIIRRTTKKHSCAGMTNSDQGMRRRMRRRRASLALWLHSVGPSGTNQSLFITSVRPQSSRIYTVFFCWTAVALLQRTTLNCPHHLGHFYRMLFLRLLNC